MVSKVVGALSDLTFWLDRFGLVSSQNQNGCAEQECFEDKMATVQIKDGRHRWSYSKEASSSLKMLIVEFK